MQTMDQELDLEDGEKELEVILRRPHPGQVPILESTARFNVVNCGRRFGKTAAAEDRMCRLAIEGWPVGWFAPNHKYLEEPWDDFNRILKPVIVSTNKSERRIRLAGGGKIDFWSMVDPDCGRSRKYKHVVIDEAAKSPNLEAAWTKAIRPTLTDYAGTAGFWSTPRGRDFFHTLFTRGVDPLQREYAAWHMPSAMNPYLPAGEIEEARLQLPDRVFRQEFLAEFLEDAGGVFRCISASIDRLRTTFEERRSIGFYSLGVDLARLHDFTVLTVLDNMGRQVYFERFNQISWPRQIEAIKRVQAAYAASVVIDSTGVGDPIYQDLVLAGLPVLPFVFNAASKPAMVDALAMGFENGRLRLMDIPEQEAELIAYEYQMTKARHWSTSAPEGMHDDCVMALGLAYHGIQTVKPRSIIL